MVAFDRCESLFCRGGFIFHLIRRQAANKIKFPRVLSGTSREVRDANCVACVAIGAKIAPRQPSGKLRADKTAFSARVAFLFTAESLTASSISELEIGTRSGRRPHIHEVEEKSARNQYAPIEHKDSPFLLVLSLGCDVFKFRSSN